MNKLQQLLDEKKTLILDGAMGTMLFDAGMPSGHPPEDWNVTNPEAVKAIHQLYVDAGSDVFLTNTFGGTAYRLKLHDLQDRVYELNKAGAEIAREVADAADRPVIVAGSIGPSGELLVPMGEMTYEACAAGFAEQARGLADGGVDVLWIETMSDLDEIRAAVEGARSVCDLPICATMSYDTAGRTMMGITGTQMVEGLADLNLTAIGANCGNNLPDTEAVIEQIHAVAPDMNVIVKANAGMPEWKGDELVYNGTPDVMGAYADRARTKGAALIGCCCGSNPTHIAMMRQVIDGTADVPDAPPPMAASVAVEAPERKRRRKKRG